jgi:hypothetical protein
LFTPHELCFLAGPAACLEDNNAKALPKKVYV